ncbi:hypothetical protein LPJ61_002589 [Coemansia biformis]|uniref:Membrane-associated proteins in eicosanoid and glutathione metabolism n=1 Tax=Coemansia biformis TaxID=1286918 RepID=A0A9W7YD15_9FUNG|nr:hypothetical protein LPJ61_002589 [Coemansia biformis]
MAVVVDADFGYCVLAAIFISLQCIAAGVRVGAARKLYKVDYPDNGGGRFADKLSDEDWVMFNNIKRVSDNYSEQISIVLTMLLLAGLFQPKLAAFLGATYFVGRALYGWGYVNRGPDARVYGVPFTYTAFVGLAAIAGYNAVMITIFA